MRKRNFKKKISYAVWFVMAAPFILIVWVLEILFTKKNNK